METDSPDNLAALSAFAADISESHLTPLWDVMHELVRPQPASGCVPWLWRFDEARQHLMKAGDLITAEQAERRVLILENPGIRGQSRITTSLYAGLQLVMPGEIAPAHRHVQSALRFVLEGQGAHTTVEGEKTLMIYGDFVITPNWLWHDHGNESDEPMIWLDGLDIPLVQFLDASFAQRSEQKEQAVSLESGLSDARFGSGLQPVDYEPLQAGASPIFSFPYERTREALEKLKQASQWDDCSGVKMKYTNPVTGDYAIPTIGTFIQLLPKGFQGKTYQTTDATIYVVVEGKGTTLLGDQAFQWQEKDIFVVPSWVTQSHISHEDAVLFSFSDRPVQEKFGLWKEQR